MKLNNNYVRQALIFVADNTMDNYTIFTLSNAIIKTNKEEYNSVAYAINIMLGELLIPAIQQPNYPYDKNTEIIGLTEKGKRLFKSVKDDVFWNEAYRRSEFIGGVSFEVMADCCDYISNNPSSMDTWYPADLNSLVLLY